MQMGDRENLATRNVPQDRPKQPNRDRREINQARRRFNAGAIHKTEVGCFPGGGVTRMTVGIPAGEVGGSPPSDWGPWSGVAAETVERGRIRGGAGEPRG